jgi:MFS family permease
MERASAPVVARVSRNVAVLGLVSLLTDVSSEMTLTLLPLMLANVLGVRTAVIGLIEGGAETVASLSKIWAGWLSDRLRRRKPLTIAGYALSALAKPVLAVAGSWGLVAAVRTVDRLGKGIRTAPRDALVADSAASSRRGLNFGLQRALDTAGAVVGLGLAAVIVHASQRGALLLTRETFRTLVLVAVVPAMLAVAVLWLGVREAPGPDRVAAVARTGRMRLGRPFALFVVAAVLFALGNSSDAFLVLRAQNAGLSVLAILGALVVFNLVYAMVSTPAGALSDRLGRRGLLLLAWSLYALVYLGFAVATTRWQVWTLYALYGVHYGISEGVARAQVADLVEPELRGTAFGIHAAAVGVTALPASLLAGVLWQGVGSWTGFGPAAPFVFGATMALLAAGVLARAIPR